MPAHGVRSVLSFLTGVATLAVAVWGVAAWRASASPGPNESTFVPVAPVRVLDTRDPINLGLAGPFVSPVPLDLVVTGAIPTTNGTTVVVPPGATGVSLNVTVVSASAAGFLSLRPANATGAPTTSSLNFGAGDIVPNAVDVALPIGGGDDGRIEITYDAYGSLGATADVLIDVVGYTTRQGLQDLVAELAAKANAAEVYTRTQADSTFVAHGEIALTHGPNLTSNVGSPPTAINTYNNATQVVGGNGTAQMAIDGPAEIGGVGYGLRSIEYCIETGGAATINTTRVRAQAPITAINDPTDHSTMGCYTVAVGVAASAFIVSWDFTGGGGSVTFYSITTRWAPVAELSGAAILDAPADDAGPLAVPE